MSHEHILARRRHFHLGTVLGAGFGAQDEGCVP
jgi:hypothetical protein